MTAADRVLQRIHALDDAVETLCSHADPNVRDVGAAISRWLSFHRNREPGDGRSGRDRALSLEEFLNLRPGAGESYWATVERDAVRTSEMRAAAKKLPPDIVRQGLAAAAKHLYDGLQFYFRNSWPRDCKHTECPVRLRGDVQEHFWSALRSWPSPVSVGQIKRLLEHETDIFNCSGSAEDGDGSKIIRGASS